MVTGHLRIKNGIWQCVINYVDANGERKQKSISTGLPEKGNKRRAEAILHEQCVNFVPPPPKRRENEMREDMLFAEFIPLWLQAKKTTISKKTAESYESISLTRILPYFEPKKLRLGEIKASHIQTYLLKRLGEVSENTVIHERTVLRMMFQYMVKMDLIPSNPVEKVDPPKIKEKFHGDPFTREELQILLEGTKGTRLGLIVLITVMYGLRRSEVLGLRWRAIDFDHNLISINHTVQDYKVDGHKVLMGVDATKNKSSCRTLPLSESIKELLIAWKKQQDENKRLCGNCYSKEWDGYVLLDEFGVITKPSYVESAFKDAQERLGLKHRRFHDLRHTTATLMSQEKVSLNEVRDYLGHSDIQTTANIYTHLDWNSKEGSLRVMEECVPVPAFDGIKTAWDAGKDK